MVVDHDQLNAIVDLGFAGVAAQVHGLKGVDALKRLMMGVRAIYRHMEPSDCQGPIVVFARVDSEPEPPQIGDLVVTDAITVKDYASAGLVLELTPDGAYIIRLSAPTDVTEVARQAVVYLYSSGTERILAGDQDARVPPVYAGSYSLFAAPSFASVHEALDHYKRTVARTSKCAYLSSCWTSEVRLFFRSGDPESDMRRSIEQFLRATLRDADVWPEQNVDESHPVDIRVTFALASRVALIEIKWLGDSLNADGNVTARHRDSRARSGAMQLMDYLIQFHQRDPHSVKRGYLVVVDGRRRNLSPADTAINRLDGLYYLDQEIEFRDSLEGPFVVHPVRAFVEPVFT